MSKRICAERITFTNHEFMDDEQVIQRKPDGTPIPIFRVAFTPPISISKECERLCDENECFEKQAKEQAVSLKKNIVNDHKTCLPPSQKPITKRTNEKIQLFDDTENHEDFLKRKDEFEIIKSASLHDALMKMETNKKFFIIGLDIIFPNENQKEYCMEDESIRNQFSLNVQRGKDCEKKFMDVMKTFSFLIKQGSKVDNMKRHIDFFLARNEFEKENDHVVLDRMTFVQYFFDHVQKKQHHLHDKNKLVWCENPFPWRKWISVDVKGAKSCFGKIDPARYTVIETEGVNMGKNKTNLGWLYCPDGPQVIAFDLLTHFMLVERSKIQKLVELSKQIPCSQSSEDGMVYFEQTSSTKHDLYFTIPCGDLAKIAFGFIRIC